MNMRDLGLSIPRQFRNPLPNDPNTLDIDDVREYISLAWERFRDVWREYKETNQLNFGFRAINKKSKKNKKNKKSKKSKKRDKSKNKKLKRSTTKIVKKRLTKRSIKKRSAKKSKTKRSIGKKK